MKIIVIGLCLACLTGCSAVTEMSARVNEEIDSYLAQKEKADYVQVVYPAELVQYGDERHNPANPSP
ncbi:MAG: hypothetical protein KKC76_11100 [Proteobacteria bacterium]|nr:hypothetical protein [Pseudomonadota bacterium]MBU4296729.1 hypothetical protein [Pseudomonadota bacterium]MCG2745957.1 hypothetical protein [Desulfobulbaceae bacterium]